MAKTIKNTTVTREQYDTLKSDYDMVRKNGIEYAEWSRGRMSQTVA